MANTTHIERTAGEPRHAELAQVKIGRIDEVNERIRLFRLELQAGPIEFSPGQWLDTYVPGVPKPGGFTITSAPAAASASRQDQSRPPFLELAVQESPGNAVAAWLWQPARRILGRELRVRVGGSFVFPPHRAPVAGVGRVVLVAGGVGVNPLVSMVRFMADARLDLDVCVAYATKMPRSGCLSDVLFLDTLAELLGRGRLRGSLSLHVTSAHGRGTRAPVVDGVHTLCGAHVHVSASRLSGDEVRALVLDGDPESTLVYICGPPAMTDNLVEVLTAAGHVSTKRVMTEKWW